MKCIVLAKTYTHNNICMFVKNAEHRRVSISIYKKNNISIGNFRHRFGGSIRYIRIAAYPYIRISAYPYIRISVYPHIRISVYPHIRISAYPRFPPNRRGAPESLRSVGAQLGKPSENIKSSTLWGNIKFITTVTMAIQKRVGRHGAHVM